MKSTITKSDSQVQLSSSANEDSILAELRSKSLKELKAIALSELGQADEQESQAVALSRRSATSLYRAGRTLLVVKERVKKDRIWTDWQGEHKLSTTSVWHAIGLYQAAPSEEALSGLTRTQALKKFKVIKPKKEQPKPPAKSLTSDKCVSTHIPTSGLKVVGSSDSQAESTGHDRSVPAGDEPTEAAPEESAGPIAAPYSTLEILMKIVRKLEQLEEVLQGSELGDDALSLLTPAE